MSPAKKERLDKLLVDRGLCESRAQAQALILDGKVTLNGQPVTKPGTQLAADTPGLAVAQPMPYVSRGGFKLEKALAAFGIDPDGRIAMDIGAATGGFTDCLLQRGAVKVYAVDVGYGQLDWKLRGDSRVVVMEKTNVRHLSPEQVPDIPDLAVIDVSFISLKKVLPALALLLAPQADILALLKPQFEFKDYVSDKGFKGVVHGADRHQAIVTGVITDLQALLPDWQWAGLDFSPITGPKGNIEYLLHFRRPPCPASGAEAGAIPAVVTKSYETLRAPQAESADF